MPSGLAASLVGAPGPRPGVLRCAPPKGFRAATGVRAAWFRDEAGPWGRTPTPLRGNGAQRAGLRYERKVLDLLCELFPETKKSPWFEFNDPHTSCPRWCQPDAMLKTEDGLILFEVKIRFTSDAWFQLEQLYRPVVERALLRPVNATVVICRTFDPAVQFPVPITHLSEISLSAILSSPAMPVYSWRM